MNTEEYRIIWRYEGKTLKLNSKYLRAKYCNKKIGFLKGIEEGRNHNDPQARKEIETQNFSRLRLIKLIRKVMTTIILKRLKEEK